VPVVWGAPDIARFAPPDSYIDASAFASGAALAAHLARVGGDEAAYAALHAWRTRASFADYGDVLREELLEAIWVGNATLEPAEWYACRWCHALARARAAGDLAPPGRAMGIATMAESARAPWGAKAP